MTDDERMNAALLLLTTWRAQSAIAHELLDEAGIGGRAAGLHIRVEALLRELRRLRAERDGLHRAILDYISAVQTGQDTARVDYCWRVMYGYVLAPTDGRDTK